MAMKKKPEAEPDPELEILKAVAQAWYGHSGGFRPTSEFDARRLNFKRKPTRFKLEAMKKAIASSSSSSSISQENGGEHWDFSQSLWDSYEIVAVSKKLEVGLVLDHHRLLDDPSRYVKRSKESKNSLRNLLNRGVF